MAFARARKLPIIAVTDEGRGELDSFFKHWKRPFPENVLSDEDRLTFAGHGVSGTPTFIRVDQPPLVPGPARAAGAPPPSSWAPRPASSAATPSATAAPAASCWTTPGSGTENNP